MSERTLITFSVTSEIVIDRPLKHVWACAFQFPKWAPTIAGAELLKGEWDQEGCLMLLTKKDWVGLKPFYSEYISCIPYRRQVYHNWTKDADQVDGFVELRFSEEGSGTKVVYTNYLLLHVEPTDKTYVGAEGAAAQRKNFQDEKAAQQMIEIYLRPMKEFAEKSAK